MRNDDDMGYPPPNINFSEGLKGQLEYEKQRNAKLVAALEFYQDEATALARYMAEGKENKADAILASVTVLSLDGGKRAREALGQQSTEKSPQFAASSRRDAPDNHPTTPTSKPKDTLP